MRTLNQKHLAELKKAREHLEMCHCEFGHIFADENEPLPKSEKEVTLFIKKRTRLWLQSWVFPALDKAIARLEQK